MKPNQHRVNFLTSKHFFQNRHVNYCLLNWAVDSSSCSSFCKIITQSVLLICTQDLFSYLFVFHWVWMDEFCSKLKSLHFLGFLFCTILLQIKGWLRPLKSLGGRGRHGGGIPVMIYSSANISWLTYERFWATYLSTKWNKWQEF